MKMKSIAPKWEELFCCIVLLITCGCRSAVEDRSVSFRVMTYNIHHGEGLDGKVDLQRIATVIQSERADIVALQEVDKGVQRTGRRDLPGELAALTGMMCVFSNNFHYQGGEYGNAVLTRFPVLSATNSHYQMIRTNEQRGILQVALSVHGRKLVLMNTHIDSRPDDTERLLHVREIESLTKQWPGLPVVICGDFNDTPGSRVYQRMRDTFLDTWETGSQGQGYTFPAIRPVKRIDYIWISRNNPFETLAAHVPQSDASDHLPLVIKLQFRPGDITP